MSFGEQEIEKQGQRGLEQTAFTMRRVRSENKWSVSGPSTACVVGPQLEEPPRQPGFLLHLSFYGWGSDLAPSALITSL